MHEQRTVQGRPAYGGTSLRGGDLNDPAYLQLDCREHLLGHCAFARPAACLPLGGSDRRLDSPCGLKLGSPLSLWLPLLPRLHPEALEPVPLVPGTDPIWTTRRGVVGKRIKGLGGSGRLTKGG